MVRARTARATTRIRPRGGRPVRRALSLGPLTALLVACSAGGADAQGRELCIPAERFLSEELGFVVMTEPDTMDDWRTRQRVPGCRVTAANATFRALGTEAEAFYERLRASGWTRTPDPRDAPGESSLRFRVDEIDCLFNIYSGILVGSPAELEVNMAVEPEPGQVRYNALVQCIPAMAAAPRGP